MGLRDDDASKSWNSSHPSRGPDGGCSQADLRSTGGDGLLYCFAADSGRMPKTARPMIRHSRQRLWIALVGSFAVYLIPLVGPHAIWLFGESLYGELTARTRHDPGWIAADVALALAVQAIAGVALAWSLRGRRTRLLVVAASIPLLFFTLETMYLAVIPSWFLIESDTAPERQEWAEHCVVPDAWLMPIRTPISRPAGGVREWWVQRSDGRQALLQVPACDVVEARLPQPNLQPGGRVDFSLSLQFSVPGGSVILERLDTGTSHRSWWLLTDPAAPLVPVPEPPGRYEGAPVLSNSGDAVAWLEQVAGTGPPVLKRVLIRSVKPGGAPDVIVDLAPFGPALFVLLEVDTATREVMLWQNDGVLVIGFDGERRRHSPSSEPIRPQPGTYQRHGDGWLAWDAYQEEAPYRLSWSLPAGSGQHRVTKGRGITGAAVDPSGKLIAISATTTLSIGSAPDVVYVIRANDGTEAFRRYLPRYSRSSVVFFGSGLFAYSEPGRTHVLRIPN